MSDIAATPVPQDTVPGQVTWLDIIFRFVRTKPLGTAGLIIILMFVFTAIFADAIAPYDPLELDYKLFNARPS